MVNNLNVTNESTIKFRSCLHLHISCHWSISIPPENVRNQSFYYVFRGYTKGDYNRGHKITKRSKILMWGQFLTSKTVADTYYEKRFRVASRVADRLKPKDLRKLGNIGKISRMSGGIT